MNITSCTLTSHIAKSFKAYHTIPTSNNPKKNDPSPVDLQLRSTIHQIQYSHRISVKKKSIQKSSRTSLVSSSGDLSRVVPFLGERKGKAATRWLPRGVKNRDENPRFPVRLRALPTRMHTTPSARARASERASERAHCTHATTHAHVEACRRRARNVGIT